MVTIHIYISKTALRNLNQQPLYNQTIYFQKDELKIFLTLCMGDSVKLSKKEIVISDTVGGIKPDVNPKLFNKGQSIRKFYKLPK